MCETLKFVKMKNLMLIQIYTILFHSYSVYSAIPEYIQVCKQNDANLDSCVKNSINNLRQQLVQGIPELDTPGIEPLFIPRLVLNDNVNANFTEVYIHGPSTFELMDVKVDIKKNRFTSLYKFKELKFDGKYDIDMKILRVPIKAKGPMHGYFKNLQLTTKMQGKKQKINGKTHMIFRPIELKMYQGQTRMFLENLFRGHKALEEAAKDLLNENNALLKNEILPSLEKTLGEYFTNIANSITTKFTYDELFPLK